MKAESYFISCLNYHAMPEPMLGLALCSLYKGNPDAALSWITKSITFVLKGLGAIDPDPIEWAYMTIALLCQGNIEEAKRRAHQFNPGLGIFGGAVRVTGRLSGIVAYF